MPKALLEFLKGNARFLYGGGALFGGLGVAATGAAFHKNIKDGDSAAKALLKTFRDFLLVRVALVGTFTAVGQAIKSLVKDTGSLDAAMKRLSEVQKAQRLFTPLVGGAKEARRHVADLLNFAANTPFRFESVVEADKNLRGLTRGAFAGTGALKIIGDAAATSGNGIAESAAAVGNFYQTLHNGEPIGKAADELRQMGLISDLTAQNLDRLSQAGASSIAMTEGLTNALKQSHGGMASLSNDLEAVSAAHEKAVEGAKAAFGKSFVQPNVQNTKNWTAALVAITPALAEVSKFLAGFINTGETAFSKIGKFAAQTGILGGAIKVLSAVLIGGAAAITIWATAAIPFVGIPLAIAEALALAGVGLYRFSKLSSDAAKELKELTKAHRQAQANIDAHAAAIQDLTDLQEQYGREVSHIIDLQNQLNDAQKEGNQGKIAEIARALKEARQHMAALPPASALASRERGDVIRERMEERRQRETSRFEESLRAEPGRGPELRTQRAEVLEARAATGRQGLETRQRIAEANAGTLQQRSDLQININKLEAQKEAGDFSSLTATKLLSAKRQQAVIEDKILTAQQEQGKGTAVGLEAEAQRLQHAQNANVLAKQGKEEEAALERRMAGGVTADPRRMQNVKAMAEELAGIESRTTENANEARMQRAEAIAQTREQAIGRIGLGAETGAAQALATGQTREREQFQDLGAFVKDFESYRQTYGDDVARQMALQKRQNDLLEQMPSEAQFKPVADSLTRIGGGGGVAGPTGDRMQRIQERIATLQSSSLSVLQTIARNTAAAGTPEIGGGAANPNLELPPGTPGTPEEPIKASATTAGTIPEVSLANAGEFQLLPGGPGPLANLANQIATPTPVDYNQLPGVGTSVAPEQVLPGHTFSSQTSAPLVNHLLVSTMNGVWKAVEQSNEHLATITEQNDKGVH